jgi:dTDP-4-dehydrorhamnose 3,5-epimerase
MKLIPLGIEGAWLAESPVWNDERGTFREWFKREEVLSMTGIDFSVEQANMSVSQREQFTACVTALISEQFVTLTDQ